MAVRQTTAGRVMRMMEAWSGGEKKEGTEAVGSGIDRYNDMHDGHVDDRNQGYAELVNTYYNLATDFYEWGWGQSFHFADKLPAESFQASIARHEYYLALKLGLKESDRVLDCGCGIGGPLRNIGKFTGSSVIGVTLNQYQVDRGNALCKKAGLDKCKLVKADFHKMPFEDNSFDHCYSIEACCHSPDRRDVYREIMRCLKPGGTFVSYEWCLTDKHDPKCEAHLYSKKMIEEGDGLPDICHTKVCDEALKEIGMQMIESRDCALDPNPGGEPWWVILTPSLFSLFRLQFTTVGYYFMNIVLTFMEMIRLAPKGSGKVREMLRRGQEGLTLGGAAGTFTPMYLVHASKPSKPAQPAQE